MKWLAASLVVLACSAGCHAPKPSFNVLAPYGSSRVPPPATNSTARNAPYYNQPGGAPAGTAPAETVNPAGSSSPGTATLNPSLTSTADAWRSVAMKSARGENSAGATTGGTVALTSFNSTASSNTPAADTSSGSRLKLGGMPVNEATTAAPGMFVPDAAANPIASLPAPPTATPANTVVATAQSSDQPASNSGSSSQGTQGTQGKPTLQWKTR